MPIEIASVLMHAVVLVFANTQQLATFGRLNSWLHILFSVLIGVPATAITYRAIVTPYNLPSFQPRYSLRVLLTPIERRRPWLLYLTPGLLTAQALSAALAFFLQYITAILFSRKRISNVHIGLFTYLLCSTRFSWPPRDHHYQTCHPAHARVSSRM